MKVGDVVTVYDDPITQTRSQGEAVLVHCEADDMGIYEGRRYQRWTVRFRGERRVHRSRFILEPEGEE